MKGFAILTEVKERSYYTEHLEVKPKETTAWSVKTRKMLSPVVINVDAIISIRENEKLKTSKELPEDLDDRHSFCRITLRGSMNTTHIDVVGDLRTVSNKIWGTEE
tara:strand:- start:2922 stop:3239 length:318 start_codon:yes stop_codon:yes gene_type:complete